MRFNPVARKGQVTIPVSIRRQAAAPA